MCWTSGRERRNDRTVSLVDRCDGASRAKLYVVNGLRWAIVINDTSLKSCQDRHRDEAVAAVVDIVVYVSSTYADEVVVDYINIVKFVDDILNVVVHNIRLENVGGIVVVIVINDTS